MPTPRKILQFALKILAKRAIKRYKPAVIGITGSVGKTFAKEAIFHVLNRKFWVRKNEENFNNEIGVPMAVLGINPVKLPPRGTSVAGFDGVKPALRQGAVASKLKILTGLFGGIWLGYGLRQKYPDILVLELAADKPGDIKYLTDIVRPQIGVVTAVGEVPVHVEFYASPQAVAKEKSKLIEQLPLYNGLAVLNYDDQTVLDMKERTKAKVVTFGFSHSADVWVSDTSYFVTDDPSTSSGQADIGGLSFKINQDSTFIPARVNNLVGTQQLYGVLAAVVVGLHFGMNLVDICGMLENVELPEHRMNLVRGIKDTMIIDDTYNASPLAMRAALDTLRDFTKAKNSLSGAKRCRKVAVLGDMRELGKYEIDAHRAIGNLVGERADILMTVGAAAKFIADSATNQMKPNSVFSFDTSDEAKGKIQELIREGDVILVKGSHAMEMEKIVEEIAAP
jgi:UDP-N-acetylmuramoyl-tripeptide--D-alanyl-D-alanine ligase